MPFVNCGSIDALALSAYVDDDGGVEVRVVAMEHAAGMTTLAVSYTSRENAIAALRKVEADANSCLQMLHGRGGGC